MRTITVEEHFLSRAVVQFAQRQAGGSGERFDPAVQRRLADVGELRLQDMDAAGINLQVISHVAPRGFWETAGGDVVPLTREANDQLASAIKAHPDRFAGFAFLPMTEPEAAAEELERTVRTYGFVGAAISGTTQGRFLDDAAFRPVLERAAALNVPIYLHPGEPPEAVRQAYYSGLNPVAGYLLSIAGWGWHSETAIHVLRLILSGVFDRYPNLQLVIGHLGEMIPSMFERIDHTLTPAAGYLKMPVADYMLRNVSITISGFFYERVFRLAMETFGADRILFSVDYPFHLNPEGRAFLDKLPISAEDKEKIAHLNAERVLRLNTGRTE